jgi:AraC family transcriptional regulator
LPLLHYSQKSLERVAADVGVHGRKTLFPLMKLPPLRGVASLFYRASALLQKSSISSPEAQLLSEELSVEVAAQCLRMSNGDLQRSHTAPPSTISRVTGVLRMIEENLGSMLKLTHLAREAGLSPYHFLRTFKQVTGLTPHQYVLRLRFAETAARLSRGQEKALDIAIDCGFNDASSFSRALRTELGMTPRELRKRVLLSPSYTSTALLSTKANSDSRIASVDRYLG